MEAKKLAESIGRTNLIYLLVDIGAKREGGDYVLKADKNLRIIGLNYDDGVNINRYDELVFCLSPIDAIALISDSRKILQYFGDGDVHITTGCGFVRIEVLDENKINEIIYIFS